MRLADHFREARKITAQKLNLEEHLIQIVKFRNIIVNFVQIFQTLGYKFRSLQIDQAKALML